MDGLGGGSAAASRLLWVHPGTLLRHPLTVKRLSGSQLVGVRKRQWEILRVDNVKFVPDN